MNGYFITGIGTDVGKTVVSAVFVQALGADYWKPVQAGLSDGTDSQSIRDLAGAQTVIHPERYRLRTPMSPDAAAARDGIAISLSDFELPRTDRPLVVEGAGGMLVPLNDSDTVLDLAQALALPIVLVSRHYLGSINHTLMSIELLRNRGLDIAHLVYIGDQPETESVIEAMTGLHPVLKIPEAKEVDRNFVQEQAQKLRQVLRTS